MCIFNTVRCLLSFLGYCSVGKTSESRSKWTLQLHFLFTRGRPELFGGLVGAAAGTW